MKEKAVTMFNAVTGIDERYLEEAEAHPAKPRRTWTRWAAMAAVLVLAVGLGTQLWLKAHGPSSTGSGSAPNNGYYAYYAGPVLPMTAQGDLEGLTVTRDVSYDFSGFESRTYESFAQVTDRYVLTNAAGADKTLKLCYPVSGRLSDESLKSLRFTVDGADAQPDFHLGHGVQQDGKYTLSWNEYRELLEKPGNLASSLAPEPELDLAALVYTLTEEVPGEGAEDAVNLVFHVDPETTAVFASGITSYSIDDQTGRVSLGFYIDRRAAAVPEPCRLVLVGGDLKDSALDASVGTGTGTWRLDRQETTLAAILEEDLIWLTGNEGAALSRTDRAAVARLLEDRGLPSLRNMPYNGLSSVGLLSSEAYNQSRVMYETLELTVPAGGSLTLEVSQKKMASYSYGDAGQNGGDAGYDLVTRAGSELSFTEQTASVTGLSRVEITDNNFGFDPEAGITEVILDPEVPCYWMQLRAAS